MSTFFLCVFALSFVSWKKKPKRHCLHEEDAVKISPTQSWWNYQIQEAFGSNFKSSQKNYSREWMPQQIPLKRVLVSKDWEEVWLTSCCPLYCCGRPHRWTSPTLCVLSSLITPSVVGSFSVGLIIIINIGSFSARLIIISPVTDVKVQNHDGCQKLSCVRRSLGAWERQQHRLAAGILVAGLESLVLVCSKVCCWYVGW